MSDTSGVAADKQAVPETAQKPARTFDNMVAEVHAKRMKKWEREFDHQRADLAAFESAIQAFGTRASVPFQESLLFHLERTKLIGEGKWLDADDWIFEAARLPSNLIGKESIGAQFLRTIIPSSLQNGVDAVNNSIWLICAAIRVSDMDVRQLDAIAFERKATAEECYAICRKRCTCECRHCRECDGHDDNYIYGEQTDLLERAARAVLQVIGFSPEVARYFASLEKNE